MRFFKPLIDIELSCGLQVSIILDVDHALRSCKNSLRVINTQHGSDSLFDLFLSLGSFDLLDHLSFDHLDFCDLLGAQLH